MPKTYVKTTGIGVFIRTWLTGNEEQLEEAYRKEASREVGEMQRWMRDQEENDPIGMLWDYEERLFPMIRKAVQYRMRIYNRNKKAIEIKFKALQAEAKQDAEALDRIQEEWMTLLDEQIALCWRIKRIHMKVSREVRLDLDVGEADPFEEYEYDLEKS